ncbi:unnamed protein product [Ilex paraguariensis]
MTRSYLIKLSSVGCAKSETLAPEAMDRSFGESFLLTNRSSPAIFYLSKSNEAVKGAFGKSTKEEEEEKGNPVKLHRCLSHVKVFIWFASSLNGTKLRSDYFHWMLSLCSDVGLAAESRSGSVRLYRAFITKDTWKFGERIFFRLYFLMRLKYVQILILLSR